MSEGTAEDRFIEQALRSASDTRLLVVQAGVRHETAGLFSGQFGSRAAVIVADENTFAAAGRDVSESFRRAGQPQVQPFVFGADVYAEGWCVNELQAALSSADAVPVAVGSGTINDLAKLAAHRLNRPYMAVATAASMDGYTAYGASITAKGSKQTFDCPAPRVVLADLDVIAKAPLGMNAAGYADLLAKVAAGADWIVADALGVEPIHNSAWQMVQDNLHSWVASPTAIARGEPESLRRLTCGLMMTGFAMQAARSSRPASGAEHQFSHLWDMQHHIHRGAAPSHGFKVGIGTLASLALYDELLTHDFSRLDVSAVAAKWPTLGALESQIADLLGEGELAEKAREETTAKYVSPAALEEQLDRLATIWPDVRRKLERQLIPFSNARGMLQEAGCPAVPEEIGISRPRLRQSYWQALFIRRRFTVLDLAQRTGLLDSSLNRLFGLQGAWAALEPDQL